MRSEKHRKVLELNCLLQIGKFSTLQFFFYIYLYQFKFLVHDRVIQKMENKSAFFHKYVVNKTKTMKEI